MKQKEERKQSSKPKYQWMNMHIEPKFLSTYTFIVIIYPRWYNLIYTKCSKFYLSFVTRLSQ